MYQYCKTKLRSSFIITLVKIPVITQVILIVVTCAGFKYDEQCQSAFVTRLNRCTERYLTVAMLDFYTENDLVTRGSVTDVKLACRSLIVLVHAQSSPVILYDTHVRCWLGVCVCAVYTGSTECACSRWLISVQLACTWPCSTNTSSVATHLRWTSSATGTSWNVSTSSWHLVIHIRTSSYYPTCWTAVANVAPMYGDRVSVTPIFSAMKNTSTPPVKYLSLAPPPVTRLSAWFTYHPSEEALLQCIKIEL